MAHKLERCSIDLVRFGYLVKASLDKLELSYRQASKISGVSVRQFSDAVNGQPIAAGSTLMLAALCGIELEELYSGPALERLQKIISVRHGQGCNDENHLSQALQKQAVTPDVCRETRLQEARKREALTGNANKRRRVAERHEGELNKRRRGAERHEGECKYDY